MIRSRPLRCFYLLFITTSSLSLENGVRASELERIRKIGEIRIGIEGTLPPFNYRDPASGELIGFEVDLGREIAQRLGVKASFQVAQWDALLIGLDTQNWDIVVNNVYVTDARRQRYTFSAPYLVSTNLVVTRAGEPPIDRPEKLAGKTAAQVTGTVQGGIAEKRGAVVSYVADIGTAAQLVVQQQVDFMVLGNLEFAGLMKNHPDMPLKAGLSLAPEEHSAIAFTKDAGDLRAAVDDILKSLQAEGYLTRQSTKYFGTDVTK